MNFSWSEEQLALKASIVQFAQAELNDDLIDRDWRGDFSRANWEKCASFGIQGLFTPKAYGGGGHDILTTVLALEGLGYGSRDNGLTFAINAHMVSTQITLLHAGNEAQKQTYLGGICRGDLIGAYAMTEPEAGSDAFSLQTRATPVDGGYLLNGHKHLITFAPVADFALVFATVDPELGRWGISLFIVDRDTPGFHTPLVEAKMGLRTAPIGQLILDDCFVPATNLIGEEGAGASIFNSGQEWERACILATQLGIMARQLEQAVAHAQTRKQFGRPIGRFQAVSHRIADMKLRLDVAQLLAYRAAWQIKEGIPSMLEAALANIYMAESFVQSSLDTLYVHGGRGYLTEHEIERDVRDAVGGPVYGGTSDIQRNIVAKQLGL